MPVSVLTWANLNHGLCGHHSDPLYSAFELGRWYWLWAEVYLSLACLIGYGYNLLVISLVHRVVGVFSSAAPGSGGGKDKKAN